MHTDGEHLGLVLEHFGIMQKDAAAVVGVDPAMVTRWKRGTERLAVDSPRMTALVDFLLAPGRGIDESDVRWLRSRFAESGIDTRFTDVSGLRESLTNYLANDGSRMGQALRDRRELTQQDHFAISGAAAIVELVRGELARLGEGAVVYLISPARCMEREPQFVEALAAAARRGACLRLVLGDAPESRGEPGGGDTSVTTALLPLLFSPTTLVRYAPTAGRPLVATALSNSLLVPGRLCLHMGGACEGAEPVACGIRERGYLRATDRSISALWLSCTTAFENPHRATPRLVSNRMTHFLQTGSFIRIASDGLNPLFMPTDAFERLLGERDLEDSERAWRLEAFVREQAAFERNLASGASYREMTTAVDARLLREQGGATTYGSTVFDASFVDLATTLATLQGYLRFATMYPQVDVRFGNPCHELGDGHWLLSETLGAGGRDMAGLVRWQWEEGGVRQLLSYHPHVIDAVARLFDDGWGRFHHRVWHAGGVLRTSGDADPSLTIHLIREKIAEVEDLMAHSS